MNGLWWLEYLSVPCCAIRPHVTGDAEADTAPQYLACERCGARYAIDEGIVRFADASGYADSFGLQWKEFKETQIDDANGTTISRDFLAKVAGGSLSFFDGSVTYDAGCGAGRFSAVAAARGARVIAADLSLDALRAARQNLARYPNVVLVHADALRSPVLPRSVDVALSIGVYQHTPNPIAYIVGVADAVRLDGRLVFWGYERRWQSLLHPKYALRPLTRRLDMESLLRVIKRLTPSLLRTSDALRRLPGGRAWSRAVPIANYRGILPLDERQRREWAILDTFDWLSPTYDRPLTYSRVARELGRRGFDFSRTATNCVGFVATRERQRDEVVEPHAEVVDMHDSTTR